MRGNRPVAGDVGLTDIRRVLIWRRFGNGGFVTLDCDNIQGNVVPGFRKDYQAFVFVRFRTADSGRMWLSQLGPRLTSATEVENFRRKFKRLKAEAPHPDERDAGALSHISATWINLGLSFAGLRLLLGPAQAARFPAAFRVNRVPGTDHSTAKLDALLIVAADYPEDLEAELERQCRRMSMAGIDEVKSFHGASLPGSQIGHEHFGFKDGVSQPRIAGSDWGMGAEVAAGEFVLGYPDQTGKPSGAGMPEWTQNGSFLAFVQLQQHVGAFWKSMKQQAQQFGVQPTDVAEWVVGRHLDATGSQLSKTPSRISHIGRGYASWLPPSDSLRHRILRRGIPYGPPWNSQAPDDTTERGLLFVAYQADLERQFEHVWSTWLNSPNFPIPAAGRDALVGQVTGPGPVRPLADQPLIPAWSSADLRPALEPRGTQPGATVAVRIPAFVTPRCGAYFFAPSLNSLSFLAVGAPPKSQGTV